MNRKVFTFHKNYNSKEYWYDHVRIVEYLKFHIKELRQNGNKNFAELDFVTHTSAQYIFEDHLDRLDNIPEEVKISKKNEIDKLKSMRDLYINKNWGDQSVLVHSCNDVKPFDLGLIIKLCKAMPKVIMMPVFLCNKHFCSIVIERISEKEYNFIAFDPLYGQSYIYELKKYYELSVKSAPHIKFNFILNSNKIQNDSNSCGPFAIEFLKKTIEILRNGRKVIDFFNKENGWCGMSNKLQDDAGKSKLREEQETLFYNYSKKFSNCPKEPAIKEAQELLDSILSHKRSFFTKPLSTPQTDEPVEQGQPLAQEQASSTRVASSGQERSLVREQQPPLAQDQHLAQDQAPGDSSRNNTVQCLRKDSNDQDDKNCSHMWPKKSFFEKYKKSTIIGGINLLITSALITINLCPEAFDFVEKIIIYFNFTVDLTQILGVVLPFYTAFGVLTTAAMCSHEYEKGISSI